MLDWDKLRIFHAVAVAQSFSRASETLNLSQSAISRQIGMLESALQLPLFHRHARGLMLTEQGEILMKTVNNILAQLSTAENALIETRDRPRGPLKVTAPVGFGTNWLAPAMKEFYEHFPEISVTLLVDDRELDLTMREADVAIRLYPARHPDLVQKKLASFTNSLYASNQYLSQNGIPKKLEDLGRHRLLAYPEEVRLPFAEVNWILKLVEEPKSVFRVNSMVGILQALENGLGIAGLPDYIMNTIPKVSRVLPEIKGPVTDIYYIYPLELRHSKRINVFRDFLVKKMQQVGLSPTRRDEDRAA